MTDRFSGWSRLWLVVALMLAAAPAPAAAQAPVDGQQDGSVLFIENVGQFDARARFQAWGTPAGTWLAEDALWISVLGTAPAVSPLSGPARSRLPTQAEAGSGARPAVNVKVSFPGANPHPKIEGVRRLDTHVSYFRGGKAEKWQADVPVWGAVRYTELYPGVDLEFAGGGAGLVARVTARSASDLTALKLRVEGAESVAVETESLKLQTRTGDYELSLLSGQSGPGLSASVRQNGPADFGIEAPFGAATSEQRTLSTKPASSLQTDLVFATYLGGSSDDGPGTVVVDTAGSTYVAGHTQSANFPAGPGYDTSYGGGSPFLGDGFAVKLNSSGTGLVYATFLGGSGEDAAGGIAVDSAGNAYVAGSTSSVDFPAAAGPGYDTTLSGGADGFVVKLSPDGTALTYATFLGGNSGETATGLAIDSGGNAYVAGITASSNLVPSAVPGYDHSYHYMNDGFAAKLSSDGLHLLYATYLGGSGDDAALALALDAAGNAYLAGFTRSTDFPAAGGPGYDTAYNGGYRDGFVLKLNPAGTVLTYATFLGGTGDDYATGVAVDAAGCAYLSGHTGSTDFPAAYGPGFDPTYNGGYSDGWVVKLNNAGTGPDYATYLGGERQDEAYDIAVTGSGEAVVTGWTDSVVFASSADMGSSSGRPRAYVLILSASGNTLAYTRGLGGTGDDRGYSVAVDLRRSAYVGGVTTSPDSPASVGPGYDKTFNGGWDAFLIKLATLPPDLSPSAKTAGPAQVGEGDVITYTLTLRNQGGRDAPAVAVTDTLPVSMSYQAGSLHAGSGSWGEAGGVITWTGTITTERVVTITYRAQIDPTLPATGTLALVNQALISDGSGASFIRGAVVIINPRRLYLPEIRQ